MVRQGDTTQSRLGAQFAKVRTEVLGLPQRDLAELLTEHSGELISATRVSDSERGKANFSKEYATIFMAFLKDTNGSAYDTLELDAEFTNMLLELPDFSIRHHVNNSPGNYNHGPQSSPIARVGRKTTVGTPPSINELIEVLLALGDATVTVTMSGYRLTLERL
jgi:hypothetical protein